MAWRIGVDIGGTFTDVVLVDEETRPHRRRQGPDDTARHRPGGDRRAPSGADAISGRAGRGGACWRMRRRSSPTRYSKRRGRRRVSSRPAASATCSSCAGRRARTFTISFRTRRRCWCRAAGGSRSPSGSMRRDRSSPRSTKSEIDGLIAAIRAAGLETVAVSLLFSFLNDSHERLLGERLRRALPGVGIYLSSRGPARDPRVRARQHDGGVRLCRAAAGGLSRPAAERRRFAWAAAALRHGVERRRLRHRRGAADAGNGDRVGAGRRRHCRSARRQGARPSQPDLVRHGRDHGKGEPDCRWRDRALLRNTRSAAPVMPSAGSLAPAIRSECRSSISPRSAPAAAASPGSIQAVRSKSDREAPGPIPARLLTDAAAPSRRSATPISCSAISIAKLCWAARSPIDLAAAEAAIRERVADPLGLGGDRGRRAIVEIVNSNMAEALRIVSVERGHDPREFALIAFGGAGPCMPRHSRPNCRSPRSSCPPAPGAFSALGLVASDLKRDYSRTLYADLGTLDPARAAGVLAEMEATASEWLAAAAVPPSRRADAARRRSALSPPSLRADRAARRRADHPREPRSTRRRLSRQAPANLRSCQSRRAGAAGQSAADRGRPVAQTGCSALALAPCVAKLNPMGLDRCPRTEGRRRG